MISLMTKQFSKWAAKQKIPEHELYIALNELRDGNFDANLGGYIFKKRIRFQGQGKRGAGRTIICYKKNDKAIFIHGFAKNEKSNLSQKELLTFKELAKILIELSPEEVTIAVKHGHFIEVKS